MIRATTRPMNDEPKRPYYDFEAAYRRQRARLAAERQKWAQAFGFGTAIVRRPSDETMKRLDHELKSANAN